MLGPHRDPHATTEERLLGYARARGGPLVVGSAMAPTLAELAAEIGLQRLVCQDTLAALVKRGLLQVQIHAGGRLDLRLGRTATARP